MKAVGGKTPGPQSQTDQLLKLTVSNSIETLLPYKSSRKLCSLLLSPCSCKIASKKNRFKQNTRYILEKSENYKSATRSAPSNLASSVAELNRRVREQNEVILLSKAAEIWRRGVEIEKKSR